MNITELLLQANILIKDGKLKEAERIYVELLSKNPNDAIVLSFLGRLYIKQKKYKSAQRVLEQSYNIRKSAAAISALAMCKYKLFKYDDGIILYEELFEYDKDSPKIYNKIIDGFRELGMYDFEIAYSQKFVSKHPNLDNAMVRLTQSYMDKGDMKNAELYCAETIKKFPKCPEIWIVAGNIQEFLYCNEELAQECYITAIVNNGVIGYYHLGVSYVKVGEFEKAEENFKKIISLQPNDNYPKAALGALYLTQKKLKEGYENFAYREYTPEIHTLKNKWDGADYKDKTLLLYCDQGIGDNIQFIRYLPFLCDKFKDINVVTRPICVDIFERSFKFDNVKFFGELGSAGKYDFFVLSADLPYYLNIDFDHIVHPEGYLVTNSEKTVEFKSKYFNTDKPKIALCWRAGGIGIRGAINRTINIDYFKKLLEMDEFSFYSVQLNDIFDGCKKYPQIKDLSSEIKTIDDTASILENCDLVITADTSVAHIAGAIGKKTFMLIPYCADWRWFNNSKSTEWYSSIEIFKQKDRQDWFIEIDDIIKKLKG